MNTPTPQTFTTIGLALMACVFSSCNTLKSVAPVGSDPVPLVPEQWDGCWSNVDGTRIFHVEVIDSANGKAIVTPMTFEIFGVDRSVAYLRSYRNWQFLNGRELPEDGAKDDTGDYMFGRALRIGDEFLIWPPGDQTSHIFDLMRNGELPSRVREGESIMGGDLRVLGGLTEEHLERITRNPEEGLFGVTAMRFRRLPDETAP